MSLAGETTRDWQSLQDPSRVEIGTVVNHLVLDAVKAAPATSTSNLGNERSSYASACTES